MGVVSKIYLIYFLMTGPLPLSLVALPLLSVTFSDSTTGVLSLSASTVGHGGFHSSGTTPHGNSKYMAIIFRFCTVLL